MSVVIRNAEVKDITSIVKLVHELADFEKMSESCLLTDEKLNVLLFEEHSLHALVAEKDGEIIGIMLFYFFKVSTFTGKKVMYVEDVYIVPQERGNGIGTLFFEKARTIAGERNCSRLEWKCLAWNEKAVSFYNKIGAESDDEWITFTINSENF